MNTTETLKLLSDITDMYPNAQFSETAADTWQEALAPIPEPVVRAAFWDVAREHPRFPPSLPELMGKCLAYMEPASLPAADAFSRVIKAGLRCSAHDSTCARREIGDEVIWRAVQEVGGWEVFALTEYRDYPSLRSRFTTAYDAQYQSVTAEMRRENIGLDAGVIARKSLATGDYSDKSPGDAE